ncbi:MAG: GMC family oxidoreductase [Acidobacteria bacterium]|nr:GMC family oxidoreductase [Acidobacteriota bacterium]
MNGNSEGEFSAEVLVVGSGAGGAITAATLAAAGCSVLIAEEGPQVDTSVMATHTPEAMRLLYRNGGLSPMLGNSRVAFVEGCCVGGSTEINSAFWHRTPPDAIARWRGEYGVRDLTERSLYRLFEEIEETLGVSPVRSGRLAPSSVRLKSGAEKLGWAVEEIPRVQNTSGEISAFAPGSRRSMSHTYIPLALRAGARLVPNCRVTRLHHRAGRVSLASAMLKAPQEERPVTLRAQQYFLCGGAIQTPALLRRSGIRRNVGNSLRIHPMLKVAALFDEILDSHRTALPVFQVKEFAPEITLGGSVFTPGFLAVTLAENWEETQAVMSQWRRMALYYAACRGTGRGTVRALPWMDEALVRYQLSRQDQLHLSAGLARLAELLFAAGARRLYPALRAPAVIDAPSECRKFLEQPIPVTAMSLTAVHAFSSCPMGEDPAVCAADSFGKVRDFENLHIADASLIPDSPGANPQGTVMALSLRNARDFIDRLAEQNTRRN